MPVRPARTQTDTPPSTARGIADQAAVRFKSGVIQPLSGIRVAYVRLIR